MRTKRLFIKKENSPPSPYRQKNSRLRILWAFISLRRIPIILFCILTSVIAIGWNLANRDWTVRTIEYEGIVNLQKSTLDNSLSQFIGQSVLKIRPIDIQNTLITNFVEIKNVRVEKLFPDRILVHIEEKTPAFVYINFNGSYIVDIEGEILKAQHNSEIKNFEKYEYDIARGFGNIDSPYVEDRIFEEFQKEHPDDIENFDFSLVEIEKKEDVLSIITNEKIAKFEAGITIDESVINNNTLPRVLSWEENIYEASQYIDNHKVEFISSIIQVLQNDLEFDFEKILWDGDLTLTVNVLNGPVLIFSYNVDGERGADVQTDDLKSLINDRNQEFDKIYSIDLSSRKIVVSYK